MVDKERLGKEMMVEDDTFRGAHAGQLLNALEDKEDGIRRHSGRGASMEEALWALYQAGIFCWEGRPCTHKQCE